MFPEITKFYQSIQLNTSSPHYDYMQMIFVFFVSSRENQKEFQPLYPGIFTPGSILESQTPKPHSRSF